MQSNTLTVVGNVGDDPELRFTNSGTALAKFSLAVYAGKDKDSSWFDVTVWGQLAENVAESVTKGQRVMVLGRLEQQRWETPQGDKRSKVAIVADDVGPSLQWATAQVAKTVVWREGAPDAEREAPVQREFSDEPF